MQADAEGHVGGFLPGGAASAWCACRVHAMRTWSGDNRPMRDDLDERRTLGTSPEARPPTGLESGIARLLWRLLAAVFLVLAVVGVFLPILPTVPFLIGAAWAGGRGWPALENWLLGHPLYGTHIRNWRQSGAIPRRAKWVAICMMAISAGMLIAFTGAHLAVKVAVPAVMAAVALWLWMRPEP